MPSPSNSVLPPAWPQVLANMQQALAQALAAAAEPPAGVEPRPAPAWQDVLDRLEERLGRLEAGCQEAAQAAATRDADLAGGAEALRRWLTTVAANRQRLAEWGTREV
jgi:hypothetical protein